AAMLIMLSIAFFAGTVTAQNTIKVSGRVTNEKNEPVAGASVVVKGQNIGAATSENGEYSISAPSNATLVVSAVGYPAQEIPVKGKAVQNVTLTTLAASMEQVVVVGYGTQRKEA